MAMIEVGEFCEKYKTSYSAINILKFNNIVPKYVSKGGYIDEDYFLDRLKFRERVKHETQMIYYWLSRYFSDTTLSEMLTYIYPDSKKANWYMYLRETLFASGDGTITAFRIPPVLWRLWRAFRSLARYCFYLKGRKYEISKVIDIACLEDKNDT